MRCIRYLMRMGLTSSARAARCRCASDVARALGQGREALHAPHVPLMAGMRTHASLSDSTAQDKPVLRQARCIVKSKPACCSSLPDIDPISIGRST